MEIQLTHLIIWNKGTEEILETVIGEITKNNKSNNGRKKQKNNKNSNRKDNKK